MAGVLNPHILTVLAGATYINGGAQTAGTSIPVSTSGAQVGDVLLIVVPYKISPVSVSGSGWTQADFTWFAGSYTGTWLWKVLDSTSNVTISNDTYGHHYVIWRGGATIAKVAEGDQAGVGTSVSLTWPTPHADCIGQLIMFQHQHSSDPVEPAGYVKRYSTRISGVYYMAGLDDLTPAAGTVTVTNCQSGGNAFILGFELRD